MPRRLCIYCDHELVQTGRGGVCPICSADFLAALGWNAPASRGLELTRLYEERERFRRDNANEKEAA